MNFSKTLVKWYSHHQRNLPWRNTKDPYLIWVSEIIMQQTQVVQGLSYYLRFIKTFPRVESLYQADEDQVLKLWQGLGYYSRARNMMFASKQIMDDFDGVFPNKYDDIISLKGIGKYTAAAISSFAFDLPYAVVDGNVYRVLSRYYGIDTAINTSQGQKLFAQLAQELLDVNQPAIHNNAIMEFGALQCKNGNPNCEQCPLASSCIAFSIQKVKELPKKEKKLKIRDRYLHFFFISDGHKIMIEKRENSDIWKGLYQLPLIETMQTTHEEEIIGKQEFQKLVKKQTFHINSIKKTSHKLTHQNLHISFYEIKIPQLINKDYLLIEESQYSDYAFPQPIQKYLEKR
ncbi:MAG: A/G-specific adenine glycosylase [Bacteroidales bacterium]|nr:A/G-specific adenine glycosylase [Bacteroidales bacterium]